MKRCCEAEAKKHVKRHRDVAVCDGCGRLLLGYGNEAEFKKTQDELQTHGVAFEAAKVGPVFVIAKDRAPVGAANGGEDSSFDEDEDEDDDQP